MQSIENVADQPIGLPLLADDLIELHAARLLLLVKFCGTSNKIEGLTKLAKLDFFVRYPQFFAKASKSLGNQVQVKSDNVESSMIRYHYGPWDPRYYQILPYLEARELLKIEKQGKTFIFSLTSKGQSAVTALSTDSSFSELKEHMQEVKKTFGSRNGSYLKNLIYKVFEQEVSRKELGQVIE